MSVDEDGMRTLLGCSAKRHCGVDSELASFVRRGGHNTTLAALSANNDRLSFQRGIVEFFHRNKESVHVDVEDGARKRGLLGSSHAERILAAAVVALRCAQSDVLVIEAAVRIRLMPGRALRTTSHIAFLFCGLISLFTGVPYAMLRGVGLPVQSEWVIFVVALALIGVCSVTLGVLPRSWIAKGCRKGQDDQRLFSVLLKVLGIFAVVFYFVAVFAYFSPNRWNLNPQLMLALCPMYLVKMTFDPSPVAIFLLLAPMNATVFGSLGLTLGYAWLCFQGCRSSQDPKTD
jgi:hypothetical protein